MKLTNRERVGAVIAAVMILLVFGIMGISWLTTSLGNLSTNTKRLKKEQSDLEFKKGNIDLAAARLSLYKDQSLPGDLGEARAVYHSWLVETTEKRLGQTARVKPSGERRKRGAYHEFSYTVAAVGTAEQLSEFLHDFYSIDNASMTKFNFKSFDFSTGSTRIERMRCNVSIE